MKLFLLFLLLFFVACSRNMVVSEDDIGTEILYSENSYKPYSGKCTVLYKDSDRIKSEYTIRNGILNGEATTWYSNGRLKRKGFYKDGQMSGSWLFWDEQGRKIMEAHYKGNNLDGSYTSLYENGKIRVAGNFSDEKRTGQWKQYNENGQVIQLISK
jgi:antitoxin component YwqK of YwqJK toxin-antitoxin module